jgi:hypothetical protein
MLSIYNLLLQAHEWRCYAVYRRVYGEGLCFDAAHPRRAGRHAWQGYPVHRRPHVQKLSDSLKRYMSLDKIALDEGGVAAPELASMLNLSLTACIFSVSLPWTSTPEALK